MNRVIFLLALVFFISCGKDLCEGVDCLNGDCEEGICNCDEGFTGLTCEKEVLPSKVLITDVWVDDYPEFRPDGSTWDPVLDDPDPEVRAAIRKGSTLLWVSTVFWGSPGDLTLHYGISPDLEINEVETTLEFVLFDVDATGDEEMISYSFQAYFQNGDGLYGPASSFGTENLDFTIALEYEF